MKKLINDKRENEINLKISKYQSTIKTMQKKIEKLDKNIIFHEECIKKNKELIDKIKIDIENTTRLIESANNDLIKLKTDISLSDIDMDKLINLINNNKEFLRNEVKVASNNENKQDVIVLDVKSQQTPNGNSV